MFKAGTLRKWIGWVMGGIVILSILIWYFTRETLPPTIRIASAYPGGLYHRFANTLGPELQNRTNTKINILETAGSVENRTLLLDKKAELAIIQAGSVNSDDLAILAPLYHEVVHIVVRRESNITDVQGLQGKHVVLGPSGSGMRESAKHILAHYQIEEENLYDTEKYFLDLLNNPSLDAAIITTGFLNPDLQKLLKTGLFDILPILDANALSIRHYFFTPIEIPRGLYLENPPIPANSIPTVASISFLVGQHEIERPLIDLALAAIYDGDLRRKIPTLIPASQAREQTLLRLHSEARSFHDPYGGIGVLANFMESIAAIKELLFALGAGIYLLWDRVRRMREREQKAAIKIQKEHLDSLLNKTVLIERAQIETNDLEKLGTYLNEVTKIKLQALEELTDESLRGDQMFSIFLTQCANLIRKIQARMSFLARSQSDQGVPKEGDV